MNKYILMGLALFLLFAGCTTKAHISTTAEKAVQTEFKQTSTQPNQKGKQFSYYQPKELTVSKRGMNTIIFKDKKENPYILFVSSNEGPKSKLNDTNDSLSLKNGDYKKTFQSSRGFSYLILRHLTKGQYELIVDRGGVKMSTKTTLDQVDSVSKMLAKVVHLVT